jgi:hypothetical protein
MITTTEKLYTPNSKDIRYINRDFIDFKQALIEFAKSYFPNTYKDFSPASPGTMFIEMAAYVGDVLSYYTDYVFKEGLIETTTERKNILALCKYLGYKVKPTYGATGLADFYQLCPAKEDDDGNYVVDEDYLLTIKEHAQLSNNVGAYYILNETIDFKVNSAFSPRTDSVYSRKSNGNPEFFLLKKSGKISSGQIVTKQIQISTPSQFLKIYLDEENVLAILEVRDSDNNKWHEVDYLAQEMVPIEIPNDLEFEGTLVQYKDSVPYILKYIRTPRRFITNINENNLTYLEFGAGLEGFDEEFVTFDSNLVGIGLENINNYNIPIDPSDFLKNKTYGMAPSNTTLTIKYIIGGGILSNCSSNSVVNINSVELNNSINGLLPEQINLLNTVQSSLSVNNSIPITGGKDAETDEEIKLNALANFASQNRAVTKNDYLSRLYLMPPKLGSIAKAQIVTDNSLTSKINRMAPGFINMENFSFVEDSSENFMFRKLSADISNPFSINIYILTYDENKNLTKANGALINNIINYLKQYRMLTDGANVIDGYIINIGVNFSVTIYKGYNKKEVLKNCIIAVKNFFNIDNWGFSQLINLSQLQLEIAKVEGVQSIVNVEIINKTILDGNYSPIEYDINSATKNNIIYPPVDPACWEIKYPDNDIKATAL